MEELFVEHGTTPIRERYNTRISIYDARNKKGKTGVRGSTVLAVVWFGLLRTLCGVGSARVGRKRGSLFQWTLQMTVMLFKHFLSKRGRQEITTREKSKH